MSSFDSSSLFEAYIKPYISAARRMVLNPTKIADLLKAQGIALPLVSVLQIIIDLLDCVLTSNQKVQKRWNRLLVVLGILEVPIEPLATAINITELLANEVTVPLPAEKIIDWIKKPRVYSDASVQALSGTNDDSAKKAVEAALTSAFNARSDLGPYNVASKLMLKIWHAVASHPRLASLVEERDILLIFKGGIAQRLMLTAVFPDHTEAIHKAFGLGGDNDCGIMINPSLPDYDNVRRLVISVVHTQTIILSQFALGESTLLDAANDVVEITPTEGLKLSVVPAARKHFAINPTDSTIRYFPCESELYSSSNELDFLDGGKQQPVVCSSKPKPRVCDFKLIRIKRAFEVIYTQDTQTGPVTYYAPASAELLDIAISGKRDGKLCYDHFLKYKNWSFMTLLKQN